MAFFKFRRGGPQGNEARGAVAAVPTESVEALRRRARHRLLGAAVLVLVGVIGFPLLFDTQPRPISTDIPIEIPDRSKAKPLALPTPPAPTTTSAAKPEPKADAKVESKADAKADAKAEAAAASAANAAAPVGDGIITEAADGSEIPPSKLAGAEPKSDPAPDGKPAVVATPKPEPKPKPEAKPDTKDTKTAAKPAPKADDGDRARALLEGKSVAVASAAAAASPSSSSSTAGDDNGRFVIQVGAFADADKAKEVRQKLEKAGLKTFTNVAKTADGERTRVRVGPFSSRAEADRAAGKVKGLSLPASVLSL